MVRNSQGDYIPGIVGSKPPHYMSEQEKRSPLEFGQLYVDIGARSREEAVEILKYASATHRSLLEFTYMMTMIS